MRRAMPVLAPIRHRGVARHHTCVTPPQPRPRRTPGVGHMHAAGIVPAQIGPAGIPPGWPRRAGLRGTAGPLPRVRRLSACASLPPVPLTGARRGCGGCMARPCFWWVRWPRLRSASRSARRRRDNGLRGASAENERRPSARVGNCTAGTARHSQCAGRGRRHPGWFVVSGSAACLVVA